MINVYTYRNRLVPFYQLPFFKAEDTEEMKKICARACLLNKDEALKANMDVSELYHLGTYDDETGQFDLFDKPVFVIDLGQYFKEGDIHE